MHLLATLSSAIRFSYSEPNDDCSSENSLASPSHRCSNAAGKERVEALEEEEVESAAAGCSLPLAAWFARRNAAVCSSLSAASALVTALDSSSSASDTSPGAAADADASPPLPLPLAPLAADARDPLSSLSSLASRRLPPDSASVH